MQVLTGSWVLEIEWIGESLVCRREMANYPATVPMLNPEPVDHSVSVLIVEYKTIVDRSAWLVETAKPGELPVLDGVRLTTMADNRRYFPRTLIAL